MLAQPLTNGVLLGATYALFALGFTLMFGVLRVISLAYGFYFSAGAFMALYLTRWGGLGIWAALALAALATGLLATATPPLTFRKAATIACPIYLTLV